MFYEKIDLGLERVREAALYFNNPQDNVKIIHIAGTNGKGSTGRMISTALINRGFKTGHFSSPSVIDENDIWQINSVSIDNVTRVNIENRIKKFSKDLTQFEIETLIAYIWFSEAKCDYAVIETGMGGRLDATNICDNKILSVITPIDIDHTSFLGDSLYKIASEKAGIIKNNNVVSACQKYEAKRALEEKCQSIRYVNKPENIRYSLEKSIFDYGRYKNIEINLLGKYQVDNACLDLEALDYL